MQHHHKAYNGRSHIKKQNNTCKQKISFAIRKAKDAKNNLKKLFPLLSYQLQNGKAKSIYQHTNTITEKRAV
ncbi:MAG: hypothetical protein H0W75_07400 [Chitinophagaceae bacterium]|nr:hypothetical protein [Chitinophagaceae bacterium]